MIQRSFLRQISIVMLLVCLLAAAAVSQTTEFSYQGRLSNPPGTPANGLFDFQFTVFDAISGGSAIVGQQRLNVTAVNGVFNVSLDFGAGAFPGPNRYLEIAVRPTGSGAFTTLSPRQPILSAPYAIKSLNAANADNSVSLGGLAASRFVQQDAGGNVSVGGNLTVNGTATNSIVNAATQFNLGGQRVMGNAGTDNFYVGSEAGASLTSGVQNSFFGIRAGASNPTGSLNSFFGFEAGFKNNTGGANSFFGTLAGRNNTTGDQNSFFGRSAGLSNSQGADNSFFGYVAGLSNTLGGSNSFFGSLSGWQNTTGYDNAFFGQNSGSANTTGFENSFFGKSAGLRNTTGSDNSFFGINAGINNTTGINNTFVGAASGTSNSNGVFNVYVGRFAGLAATSGSSNVFVGASAGENNTTGNFNTFVGTSAGGGTCPQAPCPVTLTGSSNSFFGASSGAATTTGNLNSFFGNNAGSANTTGTGNTFVGTTSGVSNTIGDFNAFFGTSSGENNLGGTDNAFFGTSTGHGNTSGNKNSFFGRATGSTNGTGNSNTAVGYFADFGSGNLTNATAIGANSRADQSNTLILGSVAGVNGATNSVNVGIGTSAPASRLTVAGLIETTTGGVKFPDGTTQTTAAAALPTNLVNSVNSITGNVTLAAGSNVTITPSGNTLTIASTSSGGGLAVRTEDGTTNVPNVSELRVTNGSLVNNGAGSVSISTVDPSKVILNQTIQQAAANFNVAGTGKANIFDATQYNMGGTRFASSLGLGSVWIGKGAGSVIPSPGNSDDFNTYVGASAGGSSDGQSNAFFGASAGGTNHFGSQNTFLGYSSGFSNTDGSNNTFVGANANLNTTGSNNTFIGLSAGVSNTIGSNNTVIGTGANVGANNLTFATAVGANAFVSSNNTVVLGRNLDTVQVPGNLIVQGTFSNPSDFRLKQNIRSMHYGLRDVMMLRPVTWTWKDRPSDKTALGLVAQDVMPVLPELVEKGTDKNGMLSINYLGLVPVVIKAMQEQQEEIRQQQKQITEQQRQIDELKKIVCLANRQTDLCKE